MQEPRIMMIELADELLRNARAGKLDWEVQEYPEEISYTVYFPDVSLSITYNRMNDFALELINAEGEMIESLHSSIAPQVWERLNEIYGLARRQTLDIDGNINRALGYLRRR